MHSFGEVCNIPTRAVERNGNEPNNQTKWAVSSGGEHYLDTVGVTSSNLVSPTIYICGHGSVGRAPPCQGGGRGFEPRCPLQFIRSPFSGGLLLIMARWPSGKAGACKALTTGSNPVLASIFADMAQLVEHHLAKVGVAGSSPVVRSRNSAAEASASAVFVFEHVAGLEPMRWNSVKKTAQWAVFRNSPEGFSLRGRGARSASMSPLCPLQSLLRRSDERRFFV